LILSTAKIHTLYWHVAIVVITPYSISLYDLFFPLPPEMGGVAIRTNTFRRSILCEKPLALSAPIFLAGSKSSVDHTISMGEIGISVVPSPL